ncbi:MAG: L,D-transpeptidase [Leptolyngbyaceae cyanobacterium]
MPRRVTSTPPHQVAYPRYSRYHCHGHRQNSAVAQAFMVLSFVSAGLLLSVQFVDSRQSTSSHADAAEGLEVSEVTQVPPRLSTIQQLIGWGQGIWDSTPKREPALLVPPFLQSFDHQPLDYQSLNNRLDSNPLPINDTERTIQPENVALEEGQQPDIRRTEMSILVDLSDRQLTLYERNVQIHTYPIAVGKTGWETPVGEFMITDKDPTPTWRHPLTGELVPAGVENPLGTRWIGFWTDGIHQIGFHGTNQAQSIGQAISHGCIRLHNADIETLYPNISIGTPIIVQP